jgi:hypothetical protein
LTISSGLCRFVAILILHYPKHNRGPLRRGRVRARTLARLAELEPALHRRWFSPLTLAGYEGGVLALRAPSRFLAQYVQTHHQRLLRGAAQLEFPGLRRIEIGV